jgi:NAD(P)-dependent dehydrogenase (short-subunit alcohol dehydrogenase family)
VDTFGAVHVLCNNAGVGIFSPIAKTTLDDWEWVIGVDLWGPIHGVSVFLPLIERRTRATSTRRRRWQGLIAGGAAVPYNVAKHGVIALMATLERELRAAKSPVRASVLCPGAVNTGIGANSIESRRARRGQATERTREGDKLGSRMSAALAEGMDPDEVGPARARRDPERHVLGVHGHTPAASPAPAGRRDDVRRTQPEPAATGVTRR